MPSEPTLLTEKNCHQNGWWLLILLTALLYLPGTQTIPLMDRDEPRFANATVEMMQRGTWTVPYFNGQYRFDKPPLTYWWMRLHYHLLGVSELAARLHGVVAVFLTALLISGLAKRVTGSSRTGVIAGLLWLTTTQVLIHGRLCVADMPMILCVSLACRALLELVVMQNAKPQALWWWTLWLALGFGFLAKGPIAWLIPAVTLLVWRFALWRKPTSWQHLHFMPGIVVMLAPVAVWGIPALIETRGLFWDIGMGRHVVQRGMEVLNGRKFIPGYYLLSTWFSLFPWLFFIGPVYRMLRANKSATSAFLAAWFLAAQVVFFFYATQLPHYVMPGYPAFIVLLAVAWRKQPTVPKLAVWGTSIISALILVVCIALWLLPIPSPELQALARSTASLLVALFILGGLASTFAWRGRGLWRWLLPLLAIAATVSCLVPFSQNLRRTSVTLQLSEHLQSLPADARFLSSGYDEPSLVFYTQRRWETGVNMNIVHEQLALSNPCAVVLLRREWTLDHWIKSLAGGQNAPGPSAKDRSAEVDALRNQHPDLEYHLVEGFNGARSSWTESVLLLRRR